MADQWTYDTARHAYVSVATGEYMSWAESVAIRDQFILARQQLARDLVARYIAREITFRQFALAFNALTAETFTALSMFGAGGAERWAQLPGAQRALDRLLQAQIPYAEGFLQEIIAGTLTPEAIANRATLYQGAAVEAYETANADDWEIELPYYPAEDTICQTNCRCAWNLETVFEDDDEVTYATWVTEGDDNVCDTCAERGAEWQRVEMKRTTKTDVQRITTSPVRPEAQSSADDLMRRAGFSEPTPPQDVRCPVCGRLQFRAASGASGIIERKCDKCKEPITIDLSAPMLANAGIP